MCIKFIILEMGILGLPTWGHLAAQFLPLNAIRGVHGLIISSKRTSTGYSSAQEEDLAVL